MKNPTKSQTLPSWTALSVEYFSPVERKLGLSQTVSPSGWGVPVRLGISLLLGEVCNFDLVKTVVTDYHEKSDKVTDFAERDSFVR